MLSDDHCKQIILFLFSADPAKERNCFCKKIKLKQVRFLFSSDSNFLGEDALLCRIYIVDIKQTSTAIFGNSFFSLINIMVKLLW